MRLDPLRVAVAALTLGPDVALAPFLSPPPDRARRADAKPLRRRSAGQSSRNRLNHTPAKVKPVRKVSLDQSATKSNRATGSKRKKARSNRPGANRIFQSQGRRYHG